MTQARTKSLYQTIIDDIFHTKINITVLKKERDLLIEKSGPKPVKAQTYEIKTGGNKVINVSDLYELIVEYSTSLRSLKDKLDGLNGRKKAIEQQFLVTLNETERRVFLLKLAKSNLNEIAEKLGKDYQYIRNVDNKIKRKMHFYSKTLEIN